MRRTTTLTIMAIAFVGLMLASPDSGRAENPAVGAPAKTPTADEVAALQHEVDALQHEVDQLRHEHAELGSGKTPSESIRISRYRIHEILVQVDRLEKVLEEKAGSMQELQRLRDQMEDTSIVTAEDLAKEAAKKAAAKGLKQVVSAAVGKAIGWVGVAAKVVTYGGRWVIVTDEDIDVIGNTPEPFRQPAFGIEFGRNATDMVVRGAHIADMPTGVILSKDFTTNDPVTKKQYVTIDINFDNVPEQYRHLDTSVDQVLTSADLVPERFDIELNDGQMLEYNDPGTGGHVELPFIGSKTDSIGSQPIPAGTDWLGVPAREMIYNVSNDGYYRTADNVPYAIVPQYFTSRAEGIVHKYGLLVRLGPAVETQLGYQHSAWRDAFQRGVLDLDSQPPLAVDDAVIVARNGEVIIDVLANDSDPDGDALEIDGFMPPRHGLAWVTADGRIGYRPDPEFTGADRFRYWATDRQGHFSPATVTMTVSGEMIFRNGFEMP